MRVDPQARSVRIRASGVGFAILLGSLASASTSEAATSGMPGRTATVRDIHACTTWNVAQDFGLAPEQGNPNPDSCGNPGVWWFLQATSFREPSTYTPLPEFIADAFGVPGAEQWQGTWDSDGGLNKLPAIGINATGGMVHFVGIRWPDGKVRVHPLPGQPVVVGWRSPTAEPVLVRLALADLDPTCGDGVRWSVNLGSHVLTSRSVSKGGSDLVETMVAASATSSTSSSTRVPGGTSSATPSVSA
jgi:hypothetical protein